MSHVQTHRNIAHSRNLLREKLEACLHGSPRWRLTGQASSNVRSPAPIHSWRQSRGKECELFSFTMGPCSWSSTFAHWPKKMHTVPHFEDALLQIQEVLQQHANLHQQSQDHEGQGLVQQAHDQQVRCGLCCNDRINRCRRCCSSRLRINRCRCNSKTLLH